MAEVRAGSAPGAEAVSASHTGVPAIEGPAGWRRRGWKNVGTAVAWVMAATLAMWMVAALALWLYAGPARAAQRHELVIPPGAAEAIATGANPLALPATWALRSGDTLVLDNRDRTGHTLGNWWVGPGTVREVRLRPELTALICSLHPSGSIVLDVQPSRADWGLSVLVALGFGPPLGLLGMALARVARVLGDPARS